MRTKLTILVLILLLSSACLCLSAPVPPEELVEKYGVVELVLGFIAVAGALALPLMAPIFLFPKLF